MSDAYNSLLKEYPNKGLCGDAEVEEPEAETRAKAAELARLVRGARHAVVFTGAGLSTSCGIPDFRGPDGVWTREQEGREPPPGVRFGDARPGEGHRAVATLVRDGRVAFVVSQNVDCLHLRSGVPRDRLAELHGNVCMERCAACGAERVLPQAIPSVGCKPTGRRCPDRACGGAMHDTSLDWDGELPAKELDAATRHCRRADLMLVLGTSLRIRPAGNLPKKSYTKNGKPEHGRLVIVNLQRTHLDRFCTLRFRARCDLVMGLLLEELARLDREADRSDDDEDDGGGGGRGGDGAPAPKRAKTS